VNVTEHLQKTTEKEFELDYSFAEWLDHFSNELTTKELYEMEKDSLKVTSLNNSNYQPLQGA